MDSWKQQFHPLTVEWFVHRFRAPTDPQLRGWPSIGKGRHTLIAAPTGSGKTLSAFMVCVDRLYRQALERKLEEGIQVVYVSPLKALANDIERNLHVPLAELSDLARSKGFPELPIRVAVRTGDTPSKERQAMLKRPPHILVTTPESLYLLLTSEQGRERLRGTNTVIVDEIHALARDKRGSHLSLSLERLEELCPQSFVRVGLSATQKPIEDIAQFLVGVDSSRPLFQGDTFANAKDQGCQIIDGGHVRELDLAIETPESELGAVCTHEQWAEVFTRLAELIKTHRSTLVFVNTRRMSERVALHLTEILGEDGVASHHGSLSRQIRHDAEQKLKAGELRAIVATASLEMGIDIGYIDLVCQIGSSRSIAAFMQRVGRSGHSLGKIPKGRLFPLTRDELLECMALVRSVRAGILDRTEIPEAPLDILAQQLVAWAATGDLEEQVAFDRVRRAYPYRNLTKNQFDSILELLSHGVKPGNPAGVLLHWDRIHGQIRAKKGARITAITSGGAIPDTAEYRVVTEGEGTYVGSVDEDFAIESLAGDIFLLGGTSWRIHRVQGTDVIVSDAEGASPTIPFWLGEGPGRTFELSGEVSRLRNDLATAISNRKPGEPFSEDAVSWLMRECGVSVEVAGQALRYLESQLAAHGMVPSQADVVFERFFDESGGMQLVIHAPFGARVNRAWGLAMRKRFCRSFDFELQAAADNNGILLSLSPQHSFPIEQLFGMLNAQNAKYLLEQALLAAPMFQTRWRWNVTRSLAVVRRRGDKRVPPHLIKFRSEDLLAAAFPETVGCLENHHGDVQIPDHPLVSQTMLDCLHEAMDVTRWVGVLEAVQSGGIRFHARDGREPSPFAHELLNSNPYTFLDGAPLEERRTRAVNVRRTLSPEDFRDLTKLDPAAIQLVAAEAWPTVRSADELHETLLNLGVATESEIEPWREWFTELRDNSRATVANLADGTRLYLAAEKQPEIRAIHPGATFDREIPLPEKLNQPIEAHAAWVSLIRGRLQHLGPFTAKEIAATLRIDPSHAQTSLEAIEGQGVVMRGQFTAPSNGDSSARVDQWCDRRLLARIHRLTLQGLRARIQPVEPHEYVYFLMDRHQLIGAHRPSGPDAVAESLRRLEGYEMPASVWERPVLESRVPNYEPAWLDELFLTGELVWGRVRPPSRTAESASSKVAMTRAVPLTIAFREHLSSLANAETKSYASLLSSGAAEVLDALISRGALFAAELRSACSLLPAQIEEALRELAALGFVTSDTFAPVRRFSGDSKRDRRGYANRSRITPQRVTLAPGRWSLFPGKNFMAASEEDRFMAWRQVLLRRYGVVFRDVVARENGAPSWSELVPGFRRMELRGEIRGGRFILGVAGEQFADEGTITQLRNMRERSKSDAIESAWAMVSAADPIHLAGLATDSVRIPAIHKNLVVFLRGKVVAYRQSGQIEFLQPLPGDIQFAMRRALQTGFKEDAEVTKARLEKITIFPPNSAR